MSEYCLFSYSRVLVSIRALCLICLGRNNTSDVQL